MSTWQHRTECPHVLRLIFFHTLLIHAFINRHLGCFDIVASVSIASVNMTMHIFKTLLLNFFGYMPKSGIAGLCGNCIFFYFLRDFHTVFHSSCMILHTQEKCAKGPISPCPCQCFLFSIF